MRDTSLLTVALKCEVAQDAGWHAGTPAKLTIDLLEVDTESVRCRFTLAIGEAVFSDVRSVFLSELDELVDALMQLRQTLDGSVRLYDFDGDPILTFTVVDQGRGRIAIGGNFHPLIFFSKITSSDKFISPNICGDPTGVRIAFEGVFCEQSYLPDLCVPIARWVSANRDVQTRP